MSILKRTQPQRTAKKKEREKKKKKEFKLLSMNKELSKRTQGKQSIDLGSLSPS